MSVILTLMQQMPSQKSAKSSPGKHWRVGVIVFSVLMIGALTDAFWIEPHLPPKVERVALRLPRFPRGLAGLKICHMSDFHRGDIVNQWEVERAVKIANRLQPDIVLLTGDFVTGDATLAEPCAKCLGSLKAPLGIFAVLGNHDYWTNPEMVRTSLRDAGITVLRNQSQKIVRGVESVYVVGLDDVWEGEPDVEAALRKVPAHSFTIVMVHEPDYAHEVARARVDLQLSGHTHGGQVRLPLVGALILPSYGRKFDAGLFAVGDLRLYVTRGVGRIRPSARFNCRAEITLLQLYPVSGPHASVRERG